MNISKAPRVTVGAMVLAIGVIHNLVGLAAGSGLVSAFESSGSLTPLLDMAREGMVATVEPHLERMVFFWFMMTGFVMMMVGWLAHAMERGPGLPRAFALVFGSFTLAGVLLIPASGFWLGLVPTFVALRRAPPRASA